MRNAKSCDAILCTATDKINAEVVAGLPKSVKAIATYSVGYDHIDIAAARKAALPIFNTPDVLTEATADNTILLMLGAARRAYDGQALLRTGAWSGWAPTQLMGTHVSGKRLGILGMGRIGQAIAQRARGFGMQVHYSNRNRLSADSEAGAQFHPDPEELLTVSDFFSLNCPATPETRHFLNARRIELLPAGAIVMNSSRGAVVDDDALIAALKRGRLAAAGLDVFDGEPHINPAYLDLDNAYLLPHLGSATQETRVAMGFKSLDNLDAFFAGNPVPSQV